MAPAAGDGTWTWKRFWELVGHVGNIQTLLSLVGGFGSASIALSQMPGGWHPAQYWALAGLAFFGPWLAIALVADASRRARRWISPPRIRVEAHGGGTAATLTVHVDSTQDAHEQVRGTAQLLNDDGQPIGRPYDLFWEHRGDRSVPIARGDFQTIRVAHMNPGETAVCFTYSDHRWSITERYARTDLPPKRLRVTLVGRGGVRFLTREYEIGYVAKAGEFIIHPP